MSRPLAYYNEIDPYAADWLRNLIAAGLIMPGDVDTRSIVDVRPADVAGYERCHWFAGIGVWDYALRLAGWPDERPVWTGSCPCQPFSSAGRRAGFDDERHLWPVWFDLIRQCRPDAILGEQVEAAVRLGWLDAVFADLEGQDYACGAIVLGSHSVGAPHIRQRLWFVADAAGAGRRHAEDAGADRGHPGALQGGGQRQSRLCEPQRGRAAGALANAERAADEYLARSIPGSQGAGFGWGHHGSGGSGATGILGDADATGRGRRSQRDQRSEAGQPAPRRTNLERSGFWTAADRIACRDGKARPVEPGTFPLVDGTAFRLGSGSAFEGKSRTAMLKGYGNAINAEAAAAFIAAALDILPSPTPGPRAGAME